jgi:hypothetical protein
MNKKARRLMLSRETLRNLSANHLRAVVGATVLNSGCTGCSEGGDCFTDYCTQYPACEASEGCQYTIEVCCSGTRVTVVGCG